MGEIRGSGKWGQPGVPHKVWSCVGIEDLEDPSAVCDMCETQEIRYVHYMEHPGYPDQLGVGCICAGHMEQDYEGALRREQSLKASARRRARWLERTWRRSAAGNRYLNVEGYNVVAYERGRDAIGPVWGLDHKPENRLTRRLEKALPNRESSKTGVLRCSYLDEGKSEPALRLWRGRVISARIESPIRASRRLGSALDG